MGKPSGRPTKAKPKMAQPTWNFDHRKGQATVGDELNIAVPTTQAERIVAKFGGPYRMAKCLRVLPDPAMHRHPSVIYRWLWSKDKTGRGGVIPTSAWPGIKIAARMHGIYLTMEDMQP